MGDVWGAWTRARVEAATALANRPGTVTIVRFQPNSARTASVTTRVPRPMQAAVLARR